MENSNALIAMAYVSENSNDPYSVFGEYIKYCMSVNTKKYMSITEIRDDLVQEFGIKVPHNVILRCIENLRKQGFLCCEKHEVKRIGEFDTEQFEKRRETFRITEEALLNKLIKFVEQYDKEWTIEHARKQLMQVLDNDGLAYDIFMKSPNTSKQSTEDDLLPNIDENVEGNDDDSQPLFAESYYAGRFVLELLKEDSAYCKYLRGICEGLMVCIGAYQLPSNGADISTTKIEGTTFYFDTRLLLRYVGCAGEAAILATRELVKLIQESGGMISYLPHTLEEMERAFDEATKKINNGETPKDFEMRIYCSKVKNAIPVITAKKANLKNELSKSKINLRQLGNYSQNDRISFGFDCNDLEQYMNTNLNWEQRTVENDAKSIWESHMNRRGNYKEYCGTKERLCVFVTSNSRLISIALKYRDARPGVKGISSWRNNRLPVITDVRLTCRLWNPSKECNRISLIHLTANAVAAQKPTTRYLNKIRELASQLQETVPEYSNICLTEYFDDQITNTIFDRTRGKEENLDVSLFASTIGELSEFKAKEQEERTKKVVEERDAISNELSEQTRDIIDNAVENNKNKMGIGGVILKIILHWAFVVTIIFGAFSTLISYLTENWSIWLGVSIPVVLGVLEQISSSKFIKKFLLKQLVPLIERKYEQRIIKKLGKAEIRYKEQIIQQTKENTKKLVESKKIIGI